MKREPRKLGLTLIAVGKFVKMLTLGAVGVLALVTAAQGPTEGLMHRIDSWGGVFSGPLLHRGLEAASGLGTRRLEELGVGALVYATVFAVEGVGLWLQKRWAEYFTVGITLSFLPIEGYELARHVTWGKLLALGFNLVVLAYLYALLMRNRRAERRA